MITREQVQDQLALVNDDESWFWVEDIVESRRLVRTLAEQIGEFDPRDSDLADLARESWPDPTLSQVRRLRMAAWAATRDPEQEKECSPCAFEHPGQGCADVDCSHNCEQWLQRQS